MSYRTDQEAHANQCIALIERKSVEIDRAKRSKTAYLACSPPVLVLCLGAFLTPVSIPIMFLIALQFLLVVAVAAISWALLRHEPNIRALEEEVLSAKAQLRRLSAAPTQLALELGDDE